MSNYYIIFYEGSSNTGTRFRTEAEAIAYIQELVSRGKTNIKLINPDNTVRYYDDDGRQIIKGDDNTSQVPQNTGNNQGGITYTDGPIVQHKADYWGEDADLYRSTKLGIKLSETEFLTRYKGKDTHDNLLDQYKRYSQSFDVKQENMQLQKQKSWEREGYWENFPAYKELEQFLQWYFPETKATILRQRQPFDFDIAIGTPEMETELLNLMRNRVTAGRGLTPPPTDLAKAWENAYASRLPALEAAQKEEKDAAREQLDAMGFGANTTVGYSSLNDLANKASIEREALKFESNVGLAQAKEADWARLNAFEMQGQQMGDADIANLFSMLARPEERERRNIESRIAEEMGVRGLPSMVSLGTPTLGAGVQGASNAFSSGLGYQSSMYSTDMGADLTKWEAQFMEPYLEEASKGGGGGGKK